MSLDPQTNRAAREAAKEVEKEASPLNPDFPFVTLAFDPFYFGLDAEPADPPEPG